MFFLLFLFQPLFAEPFTHIVLWGHKLHTHTHSYIHYGFMRGFERLGYRVEWFDDTDDVSGVDFTGALFITEGQVDDKIPLRDDCFYLLHNCYSSKYDNLRCVKRIDYYSRAVKKFPGAQELEPYVYRVGDSLYIPWATDLMPEEIDIMKERLQKEPPKKQVCYLGTIGQFGIGCNSTQVIPFLREAARCGYSVVTNDVWLSPLSPRHYIEVTRNSVLAPALQGDYQLRVGYIPCRIFKNISYGAMGITNNPEVYELFGRRIVYDSDSVKLFYKACKALETHTFEKQVELMDFVRDRHTYINRAKTVEHFFQISMNKG